MISGARLSHIGARSPAPSIFPRKVTQFEIRKDDRVNENPSRAVRAVS